MLYRNPQIQGAIHAKDYAWRGLSMHIRNLKIDLPTDPVEASACIIFRIQNRLEIMQ